MVFGAPAPTHWQRITETILYGLAHDAISSAKSVRSDQRGAWPMSGVNTGVPDLLESGTQVFSGTVRVWGPDYAELSTDSGVTIQLVTRGYPGLRDGARVTLVVRKYRPLYQIEDVRDA